MFRDALLGSTSLGVHIFGRVPNVDLKLNLPNAAKGRDKIRNYFNDFDDLLSVFTA